MQFFTKVRLMPTDLRLQTYTGEVVKRLAALQVYVQYTQISLGLPLCVLMQRGTPLLGLGCLRHVRPDWVTIFRLKSYD